MEIGIVGQGFVGSAVREGMKSFYKIRTYDKFKEEDFAVESLGALVEQSDVIFVCLPTPMKKSGECDVSIVEGVVRNISELCSELDLSKRILVIKSTVPPGTTASLNEAFKNLQIVFNPEFLTEANAVNDYKNQNRIILGGPRPATSKLKSVFSKAFPKASIIKTGSNTAEMIKYFTNCFLATKVSFANEIRQICESSKIDYDKVVEYALYDQRIGKSHFSSPGPDGSYGFGGHCFPKDINALKYIAKKNGVDPIVLEAVWEKNLDVRSEKDRDWEKMLGRAVVE